MSNPQPRAGHQLNNAVRKLVAGLKKRNLALGEKRRFSRYPFNVRIQLCLKSDSGDYRTLCEAWASDISVGGIGLLIEQKVSDQDVFYVNFEELIGHPCYIPIRICACRALLNSTYQVHGEFAGDEGAGPGQPAQAA